MEQMQKISTMDNCCVELKFRDGRMIAIDTIAVENEIAGQYVSAVRVELFDLQ